ncbi:hypothetical protein MRB53_002041 [Persea americana]|uniref:Uncharacterized protein n=1 Tax=Persea americana TaxID=3435 RepID=A0ACC2MUB7_PERAE|nr:hypothetical protein MRB53_002041 [Persea americana]
MWLDSSTTLPDPNTLSISNFPLLPPPKPPDQQATSAATSSPVVVTISNFDPGYPLSFERYWLDLFQAPKPLHPSAYPPSTWKEGKLVMKIPSLMIKPKYSFSNSAIGRFLSKRPWLEWLQQHTQPIGTFQDPASYH